MNKQRKVLITTTYNEMGIIIDTKAEEVAQPNLQPTCNQLATNLQPTCNQLATDTIRRQAAIGALEKCHNMCCREDACGDEWIHYETALNEVQSIKPAEPQLVECDPLLAADKLAQGRTLSAYHYLNMLKDFSEMGYVLAKRREI